MIVRLMAYTSFVDELNDSDGKGVPSGWWTMNQAGYKSYPHDHPSWITQEADELAEFAGRLCYQSWDRPNPATATNELYLANILMQQHFSVLEHASATFYIAGVTRALSHELVRHRHLSFSQLSQRFVDESDVPLVVNKEIDEAGMAGDIPLAQLATDINDAYKKIVEILMARGRNRKEARQVARLILPNITETKLVVTGNMRAWREFILKRNQIVADKEIQQLAAKILEQLKVIAPNTFQDMA